MRTDRNWLSLWHGKWRLMSETRKLKWKWHLQRLGTLVTLCQLQGIGLIQIKNVDEVGLPVGYADIFNMITAFTIRYRKWDGIRQIVSKRDLCIERCIDVVWEWIANDCHTGESWVKTQHWANWNDTYRGSAWAVLFTRSNLYVSSSRRVVM